MADQEGMRAVGAAVSALADNPSPPEAFVRGAYRRLKIGPYRVMYIVEGELITVERVDLAIALRDQLSDRTSLSSSGTTWTAASSAVAAPPSTPSSCATSSSWLAG